MPDYKRYSKTQNNNQNTYESRNSSQRHHYASARQGTGGLNLPVLIYVIIIGVLVFFLWKPVKSFASGLTNVTDTGNGLTSGIKSITDGFLNFFGLNKSVTNPEYTSMLSTPTENPFSRSMYLNSANPNTVDILYPDVEQLRGYFGWFTVDVSGILGFFDRFHTQLDVSALAQSWYLKYDEDMLSYMYTTGFSFSWTHVYLNADDFQKVYDLVINLPKS